MSDFQVTPPKSGRRGRQNLPSPVKFHKEDDKDLNNGSDDEDDQVSNNFPVNFSGFPHIGEKIFGFLDFNDINNCRTVCQGWHNFLEEKRSLWIELLEKEKIKLERSENYGLDDSDGSSDCSDDSFPSLEDLWEMEEAWEFHVNGHDFDNMSDEKAKFNVGYVTIILYTTF